MVEKQIKKGINGLSEKKKCFVITPIGDEDSEIRRHINGIIDAAIKPALEKQYDIKAAHHIDLPGNITKQIIKEIYKSDLVVANLTDRNPNVMYELALRHCIGKPTIMIAERTTGLPSDIISERTIFYQNDAQGVLELKAKLSSAIAEINGIEEIDKEKIGPVYETLASIIQDKKIIEEAKVDKLEKIEILELLLNRIDDLDRKVNQSQELLLEKNTLNYRERSNINLSKFKTMVVFVQVENISDMKDTLVCNFERVVKEHTTVLDSHVYGHRWEAIINRVPEGIIFNIENAISRLCNLRGIKIDDVGFYN